MPSSKIKLLKLCDEILEPEKFSDYCPNGLQVEGKDTIKSLISGVTASKALIECAIARSADAILVHHGYFWKGESPQIQGMKRQRLKLLLAHDINLYAYHLPLDAHVSLGNNAQLAARLGWKIEDPGLQDPLLFVGRLAQPTPIAQLLLQIEALTSRAPQHISAGDGNDERPVERVAWCTGAAQSFIDAALLRGVDVFLSGEISEPTVHVAHEGDIHYIAAGHHATERYGVQALGEHVAKALDLDHEFIDCDIPV